MKVLERKGEDNSSVHKVPLDLRIIVQDKNEIL